MEHSKNFEKVKGFYDSGAWSERRVRDAVKNPASSPWITADEYEEITRSPYEE